MIDNRPLLYALIINGGPLSHPVVLYWDHWPLPEEARDRLREFKDEGVRLLSLLAETILVKMPATMAGELEQRAMAGSLDVSVTFNPSAFPGLQFTMQVALRP